MGGTRGGASHNVYTVLLAAAFVALLLGVGFVWWRFAELFDTANPFTVSQATIETLRTTMLM
ncbi:hypothetical protein ACERK3_10430 [Phycisphaerales bacterium AB-hyl4]|uniref:Uncharacterized protein n=1 Tax=Natronomicrosphaera hydrolytica TaxID=3242702 RepID=A0ABV4U6W1_9BACT